LGVRADIAIAAVVQNRNSIAGKDHREGQSDSKPETAILIAWVTANFDIFAHFLFPIMFASVCWLAGCFAGTVPICIFVALQPFLKIYMCKALVIIATLW
jgi:hypothetical protein